MPDLSRDPVFGDVALRIGPRGLSGPGSTVSLPDQEDCVQYAYWSEAHTAEESIARSARLRGLVPEEELCFTETIRVQGRTTRPRRVLQEFLDRDPHVRPCLTAFDNAVTLPGPIRMMGVVNVTPDSFSDGGASLEPERAIEHGLSLMEEGANLLDVGGESTRPGSVAVDTEEELRRVIPVIRGLAEKTSASISVDTQKAEVAKAALAAGASIVNDVSAGRSDPGMFAVVAERGAGYIAMHMLGTPRDMQEAPRYGDVVAEVTEFLRERCRAALEAGIDRSKLWIDPGIGFGKTLEHNLELLRRLNELRSLGRPICLGVSRKSFIAGVEASAGARRSEATERLGGTAAALAIGVQNGAEILRVHDVKTMKQAAHVARSLAPWNRSDKSG